MTLRYFQCEAMCDHSSIVSQQPCAGFNPVSSILLTLPVAVVALFPSPSLGPILLWEDSVRCHCTLHAIVRSTSVFGVRY